jgi:hypothetical protein
MRNPSSKMNAGILRVVFLLLVFSAALRADDLGLLLSQPPSASLTADDAGRRIELLRGFESSHPDRTDEIEAYLIPFVRATQPAPAEPTPTPTPPPAPTARPMLLLVQPDGSASTMKATSFRKQGAVVMVVTANGSRAVLQALTMVGQLPWYTEEELAAGGVDLKDLAARYESFARAIPGLRPALTAEATRFLKMQQTRDDAASEKAGAAEAKLAEATAAVYEPSSGYTAASLAKLLLEAEKARSEMPQAAAKIDEWAAPFRDHFTKLLSGQAFINGAWVSTEQLAREAREKRQAEFLKGLDYQISREPFPDGAMNGMIVAPVTGAAIAVVVGGVLVFFGRRRTYLFITGAALLSIAPLALAAIFFLATRTPALTPGEVAMVSDEPIVEVLSEAAGLAADSTAQKISDGELNSFVTRHVRLADAPEGRMHNAVRQALVVRLFAGRMAVFEMVRAMGLSWIVRLDLDFQTQGGKPALTLAGAKIGDLDCSPKFAADLWGNLEPQLSGIIAASRLGDQFAIQSPKDGSIELNPVAKSTSAAR